MKNMGTITLGFLFISFNCFVLFACNNNTKVENSTGTNDSSVSAINTGDTILGVIEKDSLVAENLVIVTDTFDNGDPFIIHYCNPDNPNDIRYEKKFYESGKIFMEGPLENNKRNGKWTAWYENGVIWSVGFFEDGLKNGSSNVYYENGQVRYTKNYKMDVAEGLWEFFDENGDLLGKVMYENGKILWQEGAPEE